MTKGVARLPADMSNFFAYIRYKTFGRTAFKNATVSYFSVAADEVWPNVHYIKRRRRQANTGRDALNGAFRSRADVMPIHKALVSRQIALLWRQALNVGTSLTKIESYLSCQGILFFFYFNFG